MKQEDRNDRGKRREPVTYTDYAIFRGPVRVVGDGAPRVMDRDAAIELAKSRGMNLVQIAYNKNDSPRSVCKIMDYSKFRYEQKKREREEKRRQREAVAEVKEIKFSLRIDDGDRKTKVTKIRELLADGDKVKLTIRLIRREMSSVGQEMARDGLKALVEELSDVAEIDQAPSAMGNTISCTIRRK